MDMETTDAQASHTSLTDTLQTGVNERVIQE